MRCGHKADTIVLGKHACSYCYLVDEEDATTPVFQKACCQVCGEVVQYEDIPEDTEISESDGMNLFIHKECEKYIN